MFVEWHRRYHFGRDPAVVSDFAQGRHHRRPVDVAREKVAKPVDCPDIAAKVLEMDPADLAGQDPDPVLRITEEEDIPGIEITRHVLALEAFDEGFHLQRA